MDSGVSGGYAVDFPAPRTPPSSLDDIFMTIPPPPPIDDTLTAIPPPPPSDDDLVHPSFDEVECLFLNGEANGLDFRFGCGFVSEKTPLSQTSDFLNDCGDFDAFNNYAPLDFIEGCHTETYVRAMDGLFTDDMELTQEEMDTAATIESLQHTMEDIITQSKTHKDINGEEFDACFNEWMFGTSTAISNQ